MNFFNQLYIELTNRRAWQKPTIFRVAVAIVSALFAYTAVVVIKSCYVPEKSHNVKPQRDFFSVCRVYCGVFSPESKHFVIGTSKGVQVRDANTGKLIMILQKKKEEIRPGHSHEYVPLLHKLEYSPDGKYIIGLDEDAHLWNATTGNYLATLTPDNPYRGYKSGIQYATFNATSTRIITRCDPVACEVYSNIDDRSTIRLWEVPSGKLIADLRFGDHVGISAEFSPDGKQVITVDHDKHLGVDKNIRTSLWSAADGKLLLSIKTHQSRYLPAVFSPDSKTFLTCDGLKTTVWQSKNGKQLFSVINKGMVIRKGVYNSIREAKFISDGTTILTWNSQQICIWKNKKLAVSIDLGAELGRSSLAIPSVDSKSIITASTGDHRIKIWEMETGKLIKTLADPKIEKMDWPLEVNLSFNSQRAITWDRNNYFRLWDSDEGKLLFTANFKKFGTAIFSPNDKRILLISSYNYYNESEYQERADNTTISQIPAALLLDANRGNTILSINNPPKP